MTRKRYTAPVAAQAERQARRKLASEAANLVRPWVIRQKALGIMSRNAADWLDRLVDEMEAGEL